jgi:hypothetical protein
LSASQWSDTLALERPCKQYFLIWGFFMKFIHSTMHTCAVIALILPVLFRSTEAHANQQQYRALMTKFFLSPNRYAIPLFSNGNVKSGDVLRMPQEATYLPRKACYDLKNVKYTSLNSESLKASFDIAAQAGGSIPLQKIAAIEAELGGKLRTDSSIILDPLSQEEPREGIAALQKPNADQKCDVIRSILRGSEADHILVTRVFHGKQSAIASIAVAGGAQLDARIKEKRIRDILGSAPDIHLAVSGSTATVQIAKSPDALSLAVQSALIKPRELARIYARTQSGSQYQLEWLVEEYIRGSEPNALWKTQTALQIALKELGLFFGSVGKLYSAAFSGDGAVPLAQAASDIPPSHWRALAVVAAAHEIVSLPSLPSPR